MTLRLLAVQEAAQALLDCVCTELDAVHTEIPGLAGCPCRACVVPGAPAADGCDGGCNVPAGEWPGQLTVNTVRLFGTDLNSFPREVLTVRDALSCGTPEMTALELAVTVWRCTPTSNDQGCPPPCADLSASATQLHADMVAVQRAILCCFGKTASTRKGRRFVPGQSVTIGPEGGCVGFQQRVTVLLDS